MKNQSTGQVKSLVCDQNVQWNYQRQWLVTIAKIHVKHFNHGATKCLSVGTVAV